MERPFHVFDLDGTLVRGNSSFGFFFYLLRKRKLPWSAFFGAAYLFVLFRWGGMTVQRFHERVFGLFLKGRERGVFLGEVEGFLDEWLEQRVDEEVLASAVGERIILSSSPDFLVGPIARRLGIEEWAASEYGVDKEGLFCEISKVVDGEKKREVALEMARGRSVHAYSDSEHDAPLLERADLVCLVRPSRKLKRMAQQKGWLK